MSYKEQFRAIWTNIGPFVPQGIAAKIMNLSKGRVSEMVKNKEIPSVTPPQGKTPMVILTAAMNYEPHENKKRFKKIAEEKAKYK